MGVSKDKRILDVVESPKDLSKLTDEELELLANEIREEIILTTSKVGGHVSSSLGAVDIILAVHSLINCPKDKFVFDVGHQAYAHKLVTGRRDAFNTLRSFDGISGFTRPTESKYDVHFSGHAADSLSIAMGLARAKKLKGSNEKIVVLIGDASIAGGMAFEALNHIAQEKLPLVIILNDNRMSISKSVGGVGRHLSTLRTRPTYKDAAKAVKFGLMRLGTVGDIAIQCAHASKESLKHFIMPNSMIFEELGITCFQSVDGHDIKKLKHAIKEALDYDAPVLIHAATKKGCGYSPAFQNPELYHGIGPYNIQTGMPIKEKPYTFTNAFTDWICKAVKKDDKIVALTAAMSYGTGLKNFEYANPDNFVDVGIAEEHLVGMAAGIASAGYKPYVAIYSAFLQRAIDQMVTNVAIEKLNVTFCIDRAGIVGSDGVSHHGMMDLIYTKSIPNFTVIAPSCAYELKCALQTSLENKGPFAIRYPKGKADDINDSGRILKNVIKKDPVCFEIGKARTLKKGSDISILAFGNSVRDALQAHALLKAENISASVVDMRFVKPLDKDVIAEAALYTHNIICVEDGFLEGGAGSSVLNLLMEMGLCNNLKFVNLGIKDKFISHGTIDQLKSVVKIDAKSIYKTAKEMLK